MNDLRQEAEIIFYELVDQPAERHRALLEARCGSRIELREEVERLLRATDERMGDFLRNPPALPGAAPRRVGRYLIERQLGAGGMGLVFAARQEHPDRVVALKVLRPGLLSSASLRRFHHEVEALAALQHQGIAQIFEAGTAEMRLAGEIFEQPYFAMELIHGEALTAYARKRELDTPARLELFAKVCDAVQHAHQKGVIHRDLKPGNILVDESGQPKVLDFGVARATNRSSEATLETVAGQLIGTLAYMSPEQVAGRAHQVDTRSDVYSLGAILFELLSGALPHDVSSRSIQESIQKIQNDPPRRLSAIRRELRGDLETICAKAIERAPERRYSSAAELAGDVRRYLQNEPIIARPPSRTYQFRKFVVRHRLPVILTCGLFLAVAGLAVTSTVQASRLASRQKELVAAEQRASARFEQVQELASKFLFDFHDQIANLPGSIPARQMLVGTALEYLDALSAEAGDDPDLLFEMAQAYQRVGLVQHSIRAANLGDNAGARESHFRSLAILGRLLEQSPDEPRYLEQVALGNEYIAETYIEAQRYPYFARCFQILESLIARFPTNVDYKRRLFVAYLGKANMLAGNQTYDPTQAFKDLTRAKELIDEVHAGGPLTDDLREAVSSWHDVMSGLHGSPILKHQFTDQSKALEHAEAALTLQREVAAARPDDRRAAYDVFGLLGRTGLVLMRLDRMDEAIERLTQAADGVRGMAQADPLDANPRQDLMAMLQTLGDMHAKCGNVDSALAAFREAAQVQELRIRNKEGGPTLRYGLATLWQQMAGMYEKRGDWQSVIECCDNAMEIWEDEFALKDLHPSMHGKVVEGTVARLANAHMQLGDPEAALADYQDAVALFERQIAMRGPESPFLSGIQANLDRARQNLQAAAGDMP